MVKIKARRMGKWVDTLDDEIGDLFQSWAKQQSYDVDIRRNQRGSGYAWAFKRGVRNRVELFWDVFWPEAADSAFLRIRFSVRGKELVEATFYFATELELRVPTLLPKEVMMQEIEITDETLLYKEEIKREVEVQPTTYATIQSFPEPLAVKICVTDLNYEISKKVFGSTSIVRSDFQTVGAAFDVKDVIVGNQQIKLVLWFINWANRFRELRSKFYQGASGALFIYDLSQKALFERLPLLIDGFNHVVGKNPNSALIGFASVNESEWYPSMDDIEQLASKYQLPHYELDLRNEEKTKSALEDIYRDLAKAFVEHLA